MGQYIRKKTWDPCNSLCKGILAPNQKESLLCWTLRSRKLMLNKPSNILCLSTFWISHVLNYNSSVKASLQGVLDLLSVRDRSPISYLYRRQDWFPITAAWSSFWPLGSQWVGKSPEVSVLRQGQLFNITCSCCSSKQILTVCAIPRKKSHHHFLFQRHYSDLLGATALNSFKRRRTSWKGKWKKPQTSKGGILSVTAFVLLWVIPYPQKRMWW